jgi:hypothetical protein
LCEPSIGTVFTLFVVPGVYMLVGADHSQRVKSPAADPATQPQGA